MKIAASSVAMQGSSSYQKSESTVVEATFLSINTAMTRDELSEQGVSLEISPQGRGKALGVGKTSNTGQFDNDWRTQIKRLIIEAFLRSLGKLSQTSDIDALRQGLREQMDALKESRQTPELEADSEIPQQQQQQQQENGSQLVRVTLNRSTFMMTKTTDIQNSMQFSAQGNIRTEDGREIDFGLEINMSQSFYEKTQFESVFEELKVSQFCDPLVLNFDASIAGLSDVKFSFDLDCDGTSDQISRIMSGSGLLALDTYGDGVIRDGKQLFGAESGDGFADLALHDGDRNGWIDENDEIFDKLRIWVQNDNGSSSLIGLGEMGIGAIFLGSIDAEYYLGNLNSPDGVVRKNGFFLYENGRAGTIQHIDMAV